MREVSRREREQFGGGQEELPKALVVDPVSLLEAFAVGKEYVQRLGKERFLYPNLIIAQHIVTVIAESGGGKTTFFLSACSGKVGHAEIECLVHRRGFPSE